MYIYTIRATSNTAARYIFKEFVIEFQVGEGTKAYLYHLAFPLLSVCNA